MDIRTEAAQAYQVEYGHLMKWRAYLTSADDAGWDMALRAFLDYWQKLTGIPVGEVKYDTFVPPGLTQRRGVSFECQGMWFWGWINPDIPVYEPSYMMFRVSAVPVVHRLAKVHISSKAVLGYVLSELEKKGTGNPAPSPAAPANDDSARQFIDDAVAKAHAARLESTGKVLLSYNAGRDEYLAYLREQLDLWRKRTGLEVENIEAVEMGRISYSPAKSQHSEFYTGLTFISRAGIRLYAWCAYMPRGYEVYEGSDPYLYVSVVPSGFPVRFESQVESEVDLQQLVAVMRNYDRTLDNYERRDLLEEAVDARRQVMYSVARRKLDEWLTAHKLNVIGLSSVSWRPDSASAREFLIITFRTEEFPQLTLEAQYDGFLRDRHLPSSMRYVVKETGRDVMNLADLRDAVAMLS